MSDVFSQSLSSASVFDRLGNRGDKKPALSQKRGSINNNLSRSPVKREEMEPIHQDRISITTSEQVRTSAGVVNVALPNGSYGQVPCQGISIDGVNIVGSSMMDFKSLENDFNEFLAKMDAQAESDGKLEKKSWKMEDRVREATKTLKESVSSKIDPVNQAEQIRDLSADITRWSNIMDERQRHLTRFCRQITAYSHDIRDAAELNTRVSSTIAEQITCLLNMQGRIIYTQQNAVNMMDEIRKMRRF